MLSPGKRLTVCLFVLSGVQLLQGRTSSPHLAPPRAPVPSKAKPAPRVQDFALRERRPIPRQLPAYFLHRYCIRMEKGESLHVRVDQDPVKGKEIDVALRVYDPKNRRLPEIDNPSDEFGPEEVFLVSEAAGVHCIEVDGSGEEGVYLVRVQSFHRATDADRTNAQAARVFYHAREIAQDAPDKAVQEYFQAESLWRGVGNRRWQAHALDRAARILVDLKPGDRTRILDLQTQALDLFRAVGDRRWTAKLLLAKGVSQKQLNSSEEAEICYREALKISTSYGYMEEEAEALTNLGILLDQRGEKKLAIDSFKRALELWKKRGRVDNQIKALNRLGLAYFSVGDPGHAMSQYREAESLLDLQNDSGLRAEVLTRISEMYGRMGRVGVDRAIAYVQRALIYRKRAKDVRGTAVSLAGLSLLYWKKGDLAQARDLQEQALTTFQQLSDVRAESTACYNLGLILLKQGDIPQALTRLEQGEQLARDQDYLDGQIAAIYGQALAHQKRGNPTAARSAAERGLKLINAGTPLASSDDDFENPLLEARQGTYELLMDLLVQSPAAYTSELDKARAFEVSEMARWQQLLEAISSGGSSKLLGQRDPDQRANLPFLKEAQALLDEDTLLLEYFLRNSRSFLLLVASNKIDVFELPGREVIEPKVQQYYELLLGSQSVQKEKQAESLSREVSQMLLGPAAPFLDKKRILVVRDGAIHYVPFNILPEPRKSGLLIERHEIVYEPSASVLRAIRSELSSREAPPGFLAILADPVFSQEYSRLEHSRKEAEKILELAEGERILKAYGYDATRELVLRGDLSPFRYLHFATHGYNDPGQPLLSGLVLSQVDRKNNLHPFQGKLRLQDIENLDLSADLVVLSACETAIGSEVKGEGFVALPQAFMQAGAARVVVSLWSVKDDATAELMKRFYQALLKDRQTPAEALRTAQLQMLHDTKWKSPYYWAPFEIQGEWR